MVMTIPHNLPLSFWEVAPSLIREPYRETEQAVPVAVIGSPGGEVRFESLHPEIARVENGVLRFGAIPWATVIVAEAIRDEVVSSRRYIQVDVEKPKAAAVLDWRPSGYVELLPDGTWHFYYFSGWYDVSGSNIRVTGELASEVTLDRDYLLRFDVLGEIESVDGPYFDRLEFYVDWWSMRSFNPTYDMNGAPLQPYPVPRRTETIDLSQFTGGTVTLRFLWDTGDGLYQKSTAGSCRTSDSYLSGVDGTWLSETDTEKRAAGRSSNRPVRRPPITRSWRWCVCLRPVSA